MNRTSFAATVRWLLPAGLLMVVSVLTAGTLLLRTQLQNTRASAAEQLAVVAGLQVQQVAHWRAERLADALAMTADPLLAGPLADFLARSPGQPPPPELAASLETERVFHGYDDVLVVDTAHQVRFQLAGDYRGPLSAQMRPFFEVTLTQGRPALTELHVGTTSQAIHLDVVAPIRRGGLTGAAVVGAIQLQANTAQMLEPMLRRWPTASPSAEAFLVRREGDTVLCLTELRRLPGSALRLALALDPSSPMSRAALGEEATMIGHDYGGAEVLAVLRQVPGTSWALVAKMDLTEVDAPWRWRALLSVAAMVLLVLATALAGALLVQWGRKERYRVQYLAELEQQALREQAGAALRESEGRFRSLFEHSPVGMALISLDGRYLLGNVRWCELLGTDRQALVGRHFAEFTHPDDLPASLEAFQRVITDGAPLPPLEKRYVTADQRLIWALASLAVLRDDAGEPRQVLAEIVDITERKDAEAQRDQFEQQLRHAQRLESVGRLAGGVAHDFNNLLTGILGNLELALLDLEPSDPLGQLLGEARRAANSAATLTRQLLAFSRKQVVDSRVIDLNELLQSTQGMLRRIIGEDVELRAQLWPGMQPVKMDAAQLEQVLVNLAVNARDAMPQGGELTLATREVLLDEAACASRPQLRPGPHVLLTVCDTGTGFSEEALQHLFEPFFTTKAQGKGTGLGLATAYGIVRQHQGHIEVHSVSGQGTTFSVYLPRLEAPADSVPVPDRPAPLVGGDETVILVEDEPTVRDLAALVLRRQGYRVLEFADGPETLAHLAAGSSSGPAQLLVTDVVMPRMNGRELAERVRALIPGIEVLFTSGYAASSCVQDGVLDPEVNFLAKPYLPQALVQRVRQLLDGKARGAGRVGRPA